MKKFLERIARSLLMVSAMLVCQASSGNEAISVNSAGSQKEQERSYSSFTLSGVYEGVKEGVATTKFFEFSRGVLFKITLMDSEDEAEQCYQLVLQSEAQEENAVLKPGTYPIVLRADAEQGYAGGFTAKYTHIIENRGGYYANVALEYSMTMGRESTLGGELTIESIENGYLTGTFELMLYEDGSINNAPRGEEKQITLRNGRFKAAIPSREEG